MKSTTNHAQLALMEILEAANCLSRNNLANQPCEVLCIPMRVWASPLFKSASGRAEHVAVIILMDIVRRFINANDSQDEVKPILIDPQYFATELRVPTKKLEAVLALLNQNGVIELCAKGQKLWAVPQSDSLAQAILAPKVHHFYQQWNAWKRE